MKNIKLLLTALIIFSSYGILPGQNEIQDPANPKDIKDWHGKTIMYFSPHPDDDLEGAGTIAKLVNNGNTVYIVILTSGNAGTHDLEMTRDQLAEIRKKEDLSANKILGIPGENIFFLGYDDGMLEYVPQKEIVEKVCWFIRKYRPDAVFTLDPGDKYMVWHKTDHRATALLTVDGARAAAYHLVFPDHLLFDKLQPWIVRDWFFYESDGPILNSNYKIDITDVANLKWQAACQHVSQLGEGNMKYTNAEMSQQDKEKLKVMIKPSNDGKVYENFRRLQESLSY